MKKQIFNLKGVLPGGTVVEYPHLKIRQAELRFELVQALREKTDFVFEHYADRSALIIPYDVLSQSVWSISDGSEEVQGDNVSKD